MCNLKLYSFVAFAIFLSSLSGGATARENVQQQVVASDGAASITAQEFEAALRTAPPKLTARAATDLGDRFELINGMLATRKMAALADDLSAEDPGYWELQFALLAIKQEFIMKRLLDEVPLPNLTALTKELYETQKDKYAAIPERRSSSHILLASPPGLDRTSVREKGAEIVDRLRSGASWNEMVAEFSDDKNSAKRNGAISRAATFGDPSLSPPYTEALFQIDEIGGIAGPIDTQFGIHIIKLDSIEPGGYRPYEEVKQVIAADVVKEYRSLSNKEVRARFETTEDAFIDGDAMDELFAPYKSE